MSFWDLCEGGEPEDGLFCQSDEDGVCVGMSAESGADGRARFGQRRPGRLSPVCTHVDDGAGRFAAVGSGPEPADRNLRR